MKTRIPLILVVFALLLSACGAATSGSSAPNEPSFAVQEPAPAQPAPPPPSDGSGLDSEAGRGGEATGNTAAPGQQVPDAQRMVIKTAQLELEVDSVRDTETAIRNRVTEMGGFVVTAQTSGTEPSIYTTITFRVPAARFDEMLSGVQGMAKRVLSRTLGGEDVTEEFVDLTSRLRNLEATRDRLLSLLQKAETVEDALAVDQALTDVQGQIEVIKGRMQYLQQSAALSTITVSLRPVPTTPIIDEDSWQPMQVARRAARGLIEFGQGLLELGIVLAIWTPVWLPIVLLLRWAWKKITGGGKKKVAPVAPAAPAGPAEPPAAS